MAKQVSVFNRKDGGRIADAVRYIEGQQVSSKGVARALSMQSQEVIFAKLVEKDPDDTFGYWRASEARYFDGNWQELEKGKKWNNDPSQYPYLHNYNYEDAEEGAIVRVWLMFNRDTGLQEWVFDTNVTNPEAFVFYSDEGTTGQASIDAVWSIKNDGKVMTNGGEADVAGITLTAGSEARVQIILQDVGNNVFELQSAVMMTGTGDFWTESGDTITINWRIAKVEDKGDYSRLIQYYAGDIHLSAFKTLSVDGDDKWIDVRLINNVYEVSHRVPDPDEPQFEFQGIDKDFDCADTLSGGASLGDVITKINAILAALQHVYYDTRGHIYKITSCGGSTIDETDSSSDYQDYTASLSVTFTNNFPDGWV